MNKPLKHFLSEKAAERFNKKQLIFALLLIAFCVCSVYKGLDVSLHYAFDSQIDAAGVLSQAVSPYSAFLDGSYKFNYSRFPTHLPQTFYLNLPFPYLGNGFGYLLYGVIGLVLLIGSVWKYSKVGNKWIFLAMLLCSMPYRVNVGSGQFLFFYLSFFLFLHHLVMNKDKRIYWWLVVPGLLVLLAGKPNLFFWIPLFYWSNKKFRVSLLIALTFQLIVIGVFIIHTHSDFLLFISDYARIMKKLSWQQFSLFNVFSMNFRGNAFQLLTSIAVLINLVAFVILAYFKWKGKKVVSEWLWMFSIITLSFIMVYHRFYDLILLIVPGLIFPIHGTQLKRGFWVLLSWLIAMWAIFLLCDYGKANEAKDLSIAFNLVNGITILLVTILQLIGLNDLLLPRNEEESLLPKPSEKIPD